MPSKSHQGAGEAMSSRGPWPAIQLALSIINNLTHTHIHTHARTYSRMCVHAVS